MAFPKRRVFALLLFVICALAVAPFAIRLCQLLEFRREQELANELISSLDSRRPSHTDQETWDDATRWAGIAFANVCFSDEHLTIEELRRFTIDTRQELQGEVDLDTIDWVWKRLSETGPHGKQYTNRVKPAYRNEVYGDPVEQ